MDQSLVVREQVGKNELFVLFRVAQLTWCGMKSVESSISLIISLQQTVWRQNLFMNRG